MRKEEVSAIKAGIFVIMCLAIMVLAIIALGKRTQIFVRHYDLIAEFENAGGLIRGAAVRVAGVNAGTVNSVQIVPGRDGKGVARISMSIGVGFEPWLRDDSVASVRTLGILGDKYVEISAGTADKPPLQAGALIAAEETPDLYQMAARAQGTFERVNLVVDEMAETLRSVDKTGLTENLKAVGDSLKNVLARVEEGPSLMHSVVYDADLAKMLEDLNVTTRIIRASAESVRDGEGALGEALYGTKFEAMIDDLGKVMNSGKAILEQIENEDSVAHALIYSEEDRKALAELGNAVGKLNNVLDQVREGQGTLGLLIADPTIWESVRKLFKTAEESYVLRHYVEKSIKK